MKKFPVFLLTLIGTAALLFLVFDREEGLHENNQEKSKNKSSQSANLQGPLTLKTNTSGYSPGQKITLTGSMNQKFSGDVKAESFHLNEKIKEETFPIKNGRFSQIINLPSQDYQGYLIKVSTLSKPSITSTIAIDVSSDWAKFPRYGFLSEFGNLTMEEINGNLAELNRFHINGLQFYDYHYKHHQPLKMNGNQPADHWTDIANRPVSLYTLKHYIEGAHQYNMKAMAYNLLYGTFEDAAREGVNKEWYLYKDKERGTIDSHPLPENWKSNVLLTNPTHPSWQQYIMKEQEKVYRHLNFDGWHIDQLGKRGEVYNEHGNFIELDKSFEPFLQEIKYESQAKSIVMNAVNQYGQEGIGRSPVDFMYTEVWDEYKYFGDLKRIIDENGEYSNHTKNTVLAAYMNYRLSDSKGEFNEAGILMNNSVIFAAGGSHIELGEHMLSKEYFPHNQLKMSNSLKKQLISYYDFLVAYQNVLRDDVSEAAVHVESSSGYSISKQAEPRKIWAFSKQKDNLKILHFINFIDAKTMEWRDTDGTQTKPKKIENIEIEIKSDKKPKKVWTASPNIQGGHPVELPFTYKIGKVKFKLPSLEYWDMVVVEK